MTEQTITLPVTGMTCANCAANIERGLKKLEGVQSTNVNFAAEQAVIVFDPKQLHVKDVVKNIEKSGYSVALTNIELPVTGMTCANCAANIERTLNKKGSRLPNFLLTSLPRMLSGLCSMTSIREADVLFFLTRDGALGCAPIHSSAWGLSEGDVRPSKSAMAV